jgi:outer membrane autotransporter protein
MNSATCGSRLEMIGLVAALAVSAALLGAPDTAQGSGYSINPCLDSWSPYYDSDNPPDGKRVGRCSTATGHGGIGELINRNWTRQVIDQLNGVFANRNPGGPVNAFMRRMSNDDQSASQLARYLDSRNGIDLAAGYTPTETTGEFIQRWLQPLRDHHVNAWFNTAWSSPRDTHRPTRYDSDIWTLTLGMDMPIVNDNLIFGVFGSYTHSDVDTTFNKGDVESKLGTIGPYFVYTLNDYVSFDTTVAGIFGQHENVIGSAVPMTLDARGEQDAAGFFVSMNANANYWMGNWGVQGRLGFLHSDMETDSYDLSSGGASVRVSGTNNELTQISLATQFNYFYDKGLPKCEQVKAMPFFRITWNYDLDHDNIQLPLGVSQHPNDDDEVVLNWGVTLFGDGPFSGSVEAGRTFARSRYEAWSVAGTLSYAF